MTVSEDDAAQGYHVYLRCSVDGAYVKNVTASKSHDDRFHGGSRVTFVQETGWDSGMELAASRYRASRGKNPNRIRPPPDSFSEVNSIDLIDRPDGIREYYRRVREYATLRREAVVGFDKEFGPASTTRRE